MNNAATVFLVDDDPQIRQSLTWSIEAAGYSVQSFDSAEKFLSSSNLDQPSCLILDVRMHGMSGLELQDALASREIPLPIIFITGHGDISMSVRAIKNGAVDFLEKPFSRQVLLQRIEEALTLDRELRERDQTLTTLQNRLERLTPREREVMLLLISDSGERSNKDIATELNISHRTVEHHRTRVMEKMQAKSLPDLIRIAWDCGLKTS